MELIYQQLQRIITENDNFLLITHDHPDGDAAGSACALGCYLENLGKAWAIVCADPAGNQFSYLPYFHTWINSIPKKADAVIFLDIASPNQTSLFEKTKNMNNAITINIDHHKSNEKFVQINLLDLEASSTCEALYNFFKWNNSPISPNLAACLMTGILTDTSNLTNAATKPQTFSALSDLMIHQAMLPKLANQAESKSTLGTLGLWGIALEKIKIRSCKAASKLNLAYTFITQKDFEKAQQPRESLSGLTNYLQNISDVAFTLLLVEEGDGTIKGSFRTNRNDVDVAKIAAIFGGGGHKQAAGFKIKGEIRNIETQIISKITNDK